MPDLLIELFSEEIPARMQARAAADLQRLVTHGLAEAGLAPAGAQSFATPRRLALAAQGLPPASPTRTEARRGPRVDAPEKAIEGFLRSTGLARDQLQVQDDKKGQVYVAQITTPGRPAAEIVAEVLAKTIQTFPWPKSMRWGAGTLRWVRPLHRILCLLTDQTGATVVPLEVAGLKAGDMTEGHRVHAPAPFAVTGFEDYAARLKRAYVVLDPEERARTIWHDLTTQAFARGLEAVADKGLLAEVAGLAEWPVVLLGEIATEFRHLPPEVLQTSMREHQKYFALQNRATGGIEGFATVANLDAPDGGATILAGNRKVLAARLSDAAFFWENDLRTIRAGGMEAMAAPLSQVTFERRLGSQADRIARIAALARQIAPMVGAKPDLAAEAARIAKADLASQMVYEFPELQGTMGRYYALEAGHDDGVPEACEEHYKPLGPADAVPTAPVSVAVALADKLDLLAGFWSIGEKPTGSGDPFALRRAALGVIRIVLAGPHRLQLDRLLDAQILRYRLGAEGVAETLLTTLATHGFHDEMDAEIARLGAPAHDWLEAAKASGAGAVSDDLVAFFHDRLKVHLRDEGIRHDVIDACLAKPPVDDLALLVARAEALAAVLETEDGENLLQGFRRANNILTQAEAKDGVSYEYGADRKFAETDEERALFDALDTAQPAIDAALAAEDFAAAMAAMAGLRAPIDAFFEAVQVNTDNQIVRRNRLNLLHQIVATCSSVADLTRLEG